MNRFKKISRPALVISGIFLGISMFSTAGAATTSKSFENCRAAAEVAYGKDDELARVRLDGVRKSGKELRLKVFTPDGEQINALCTVDRKSGELVSIDPPGKAVANKELASSQ